MNHWRSWVLWLGAMGSTVLFGGCEDENPFAPSSATHLEFVTPPPPVGVGSPAVVPIVLAVRDRKGRTVWSWEKDVTLSLEGGAGDGGMSGTTTVAPVGGTAIFHDLVFEGPGGEVRVSAESGGLKRAVSDPFRVHEIFRSTSVDGGFSHTCALVEDGTAYCWGSNEWGQIGDGTVTDRPLPIPVAGGMRFASLTTSNGHTCGLTEDGAAYCWGYNRYGQLGVPTTQVCDDLDCATSPVPVSGGLKWSHLSAGYFHTCGLAVDGRAYCWGTNTYGEGGDGSGVDLAEPTLVSGGHDFTQISAGYLHTCGLTSAGAAYCWGYNGYHEVGDGTDETRYEPVPVSGDLAFSVLVAGGGSCHGHTCGITTDGATYCWGWNFQGTSPRHHSVPVPLPGDPGLVSLALGRSTDCGLDASGVLYCWGTQGHGQGGQGSFEWVSEPRPVVGGLTFESIGLGNSHTCGVTPEGDTYCWGWNRWGQLGNGIKPEAWTMPVRVWW